MCSWSALYTRSPGSQSLRASTVVRSAQSCPQPRALLGLYAHCLGVEFGCGSQRLRSRTRKNITFADGCGALVRWCAGVVET